MRSRRPAKPSRSPARKPAYTPEIQIVGIGASAGGLDAVRGFLKAMPRNSGLAFVFIQHFDPTHESHMAEILSKYTSMKVVEAGDGAVIEGDSIYVIPPNRSLEIRDGRIHLTVPAEKRGLRTPIDRFFSSLAKTRGEKSVCIIMSGTGSDGLLGLREIKAAGGMSMAQDPSTAQYGDLPRAAIATGLVDFVLPVESMPQKLLAYLGHAYISGPAITRSDESDAEETLAGILDVLRSRTPHDFRLYKRGTLVRRIERRMGVNQVVKLTDYLKLLKRKPAEAVLLSKDLMIGVTSFFRDPAAFEELRTRVIPALVRQKEPDDPIRIWVPGCATGEEAYSLGMLFLEELSASDRSRKVQIFATDIDEDALQIARLSHYPESIAAHVGPKLLAKYFNATYHGFIVGKPLRECVVFAMQNLISTAPFSRIDLVSCRNLAIYLEAELQRKLVEIFHFALKPGGFLFLGSSEGVSNREELFQTVSKKWRIYRRSGGARTHLGGLPLFTPPRLPASKDGKPAPPAPPINLAELSQRLTIEHHASGSVLADRKGRILHLTGLANKYLELPAGEPTLNLHAVVREGLRARLLTALHTAIRDDRAVVLDRDSVKREDSFHPVRVTISPVKSPPSAEGLLHIVFEDAAGPPAPAGPRPTPGEQRDEVIHQLENDLKSTRDDLQYTIQEVETSNEQLKVAQEEILSSNEELQSSNEELETSQEELQSVNEELATVNSQLHEKVQELTDSTDDLANLLASTEIATLLLDSKFRIKRFTAPVARLLNLIPADAGRPLSHIMHNLVDVNILEDAQSVLRKLVPIQRQVRSRKGAWYVMRVLPYRTTENSIQGIAITFSDVSELANREELLKDREVRQRIIADLGHKALARTPVNRLMHLVARRLQETLGADLCDVLKLDDSGKRLQLWAGTGWKNARPGKSEITLSGGSAAVRALRMRRTVFMDALPSPDRPSLTSLQRSERVASCVYTVLSNSAGPLGVVGVHSKRRRSFSHEDGLFLQEVSGILASAIVRERAEVELKGVGRFLEARVRERTQWLAASREVSQAANRAESVMEVMRSALIALCSGSGWTLGHVFLSARDRSRQPILRCDWYPPRSARFAPLRERTQRAKFEDPRNLPSRVMHEGKAVWILAEAPKSRDGRRLSGGSKEGWAVTDNLRELGQSRARLARRLGIQTAAAVPLKVGSETAGVVEVLSEKRLYPSRPMLDMMEQVALEIGRSVERVQAQERIAAALWKEHRAIAQELHDSVGQELTGLGAMSESLMVTLKRKGRIDAARLKRLTQGLRGTLEKLRSVTHGMIPLEVEPRGLVSALSRLAKLTQSRFGVRCALAPSPEIPLPNREAATHLFRIAQEGITNAVRHARARRIHLKLLKNAREISLTIHDDGRGLPKDQQTHDGLGLRIMRYRANALGGRLVVRSARNRGTQVTCIVPQGERVSDNGGPASSAIV